MHELGYTKYLFDQVLQEAEKNSANHVSHVHLVLGELSGYVSDSIQFYWDSISKGSIAEKAQITYTYKRVEWICTACNKQFISPTDSSRCPNCDSPKIGINSGDECFIKSMTFNQEL